MAEINVIIIDFKELRRLRDLIKKSYKIRISDTEKMEILADLKRSLAISSIGTFKEIRDEAKAVLNESSGIQKTRKRLAEIKRRNLHVGQAVQVLRDKGSIEFIHTSGTIRVRFEHGHAKTVVPCSIIDTPE